MAHAELVNFIRDPEFKCWNIHGVKRFATDIDALSALASRNEHGAAFADLDAMCTLLARQEWGLAETPEQMMQAFPDMDALLVRATLDPLRLLWSLLCTPAAIAHSTRPSPFLFTAVS